MPPSTEPSRVSLRRALDQCFRTSSDLDAFLIDVFPAVYHRLSSGMDRTSRVNLLLQIETPVQILQALQMYLGTEKLDELGWMSAVSEGTPASSGPTMPPSLSENLPLLFIDCHNEDLALADELLLHLAPLKRNKRLRTFSPRDIRPGDNFQQTLAVQLEQAAVIVLLISPAFLADERFDSFARQLPRLSNDGRIVIPLLARPAQWEHSAIGHLVPLPADRRFLSPRSRSERDAAFVEIAQALSRAIETAAQMTASQHAPTAAVVPPLPPKLSVASSGPAPLASLLPTLSLPSSFFLHLSDLHFTSARQVTPFIDALEADLLELHQHVPQLDGVVISGDLTQGADRAEFAAAAEFLRELCATYKLAPQQLVLVPGNHDGSWAYSRSAYQDPSNPGAKPDEATYKKRFAAFADFYQSACGQVYPLDFEQQATLHEFAKHKVLFLGLNSAWQCDHMPQYSGRATVNEGALAGALRTLRRNAGTADWLKIAVWHHPVQSDGEDRIKNTGFLDRLAQAGFRLGMHGHMHSAKVGQHAYDVTANGRKLRLLGAGTFGAPAVDWSSGIPLQYQILCVQSSQVKVISRCRDNPEGPWRGDGRWVAGAEARTYYEVDL